MKKKVMLIGIIIILILLATFGASVALFNGVRIGSKESSISVGDLTFKYTEVTGIGNGINLEDPEAISDEEGKQLNTWFDFKIDANLVNSDMIYEVSVEPTSETTINLDGIKIYLTEVVDDEEVDINSNYNGLGKVKVITDYDNGVIYQERILKNTKNYEKNFRVRIWISEDVDIYTDGYMGTKGVFKINVNAKSDISMVDASIPVPEITGGTGETWVAEPQTISIVKTVPVIGGIKNYEYYVTDDEIDIPNDLTIATGITNNTYTDSIDGITYVYYRAIFNDNSKSDWSSSQIVRIDNSVPTNVSIAASDLIESEAWHTNPYILNFSAIKNGDSSIKYYYGTTENPEILGNNIHIDSSTNSTTYYVKACNEANICSDNVNYIAKLDADNVIPPTITGGTGSSSSTSMPATIMISQPGRSYSGVAHYEYYETTSSIVPTDSTNPTGTGNSKKVITSGTSYVYFRAVANSGKKSPWSSPQIINFNTTILTDLSGSGNNATVYGATYTEEGLSFDGTNDYAVTNNVVNYNNTSAITIEFEAKIIDSNIGMIFESSSDWNTNNGSYGLTVNEHNTNGELSVTTHFSQGYNIKKVDNVVTGNYQKYTVVINYSNIYNDFIKIYIDGVKQSLAVVNPYSQNFSNYKHGNYKLFIGSRNGSTTYTKIIMKNFKLYTKELSQAEISNNLSGNHTTDKLILYYNFE